MLIGQAISTFQSLEDFPCHVFVHACFMQLIKMDVLVRMHLAFICTYHFPLMHRLIWPRLMTFQMLVTRASDWACIKELVANILRSQLNLIYTVFKTGYIAV